ncbi:hypothetical protein ACFOET_13950 [Parapedobacter deserti]|uniref:DUF1700 domain-containing protein n=1 Tax=Parapedobacter deserti TaxID=1912957 RepID=A0ABV7JKV0_9SPHI
MTLTPAHLDQIKTFISKRGFTAMDLQMEIIDHVACRIEDKLTENPSLTFEQALKQTHAEFGIFGFSTLEEAMAKSLNRKYRGVIIQEFRRWISFPSVILPIGFGILLFYLFLMAPSTPLLTACALLNIMGSIVVCTNHLRMKKRYRKMMVMRGVSAYAFVPTIAFQYWLQLGHHTSQTWEWAVMFSILCLGLCFLFVAVFRLQTFALSKCQELEAQYGVLADNQIS